MGYNKVVINGVTKVDLTGDSVSADKLLSGVTAHDKSGNEVIGTLQTRNANSVTIDEETGAALVPSGYYSEQIALWYNNFGNWEWEPVDPESGVVIGPKIIRYEAPETEITLVQNTLLYMYGFNTTSLDISLPAISYPEKLARYSICFETGSTVPSVTLPDSLLIPDNYDLSPHTAYKFDIIENMLYVSSWKTMPEKVVLAINFDTDSTGRPYLNASLNKTVTSSDILILLIDFNADASFVGMGTANVIGIGNNQDDVFASGTYVAFGHTQVLISKYLRVMSFGESHRSTESGGVSSGRHRLVIKIDYSMESGTYVWYDGNEYVMGFGGQPAIGSLRIGNGDLEDSETGAISSSFHGVYNEISLYNYDMTNEELRTLSDLSSGGSISDARKETLLLGHEDSAGTDAVTFTLGWTPEVGSVFSALIDFDFQGDNLANLMCFGTNPSAWNMTAIRFYLVSENQNELRAHLFSNNVINITTQSSITGRHRLVFKCECQTTSSLKVWMDGNQLYSGTGGAFSAGEWSMSNAEGSVRFKGTYNEVCILHEDLTDEELLNVSKLE